MNEERKGKKNTDLERETARSDNSARLYQVFLITQLTLLIFTRCCFRSPSLSLVNFPRLLYLSRHCPPKNLECRRPSEIHRLIFAFSLTSKTCPSRAMTAGYCTIAITILYITHSLSQSRTLSP